MYKCWNRGGKTVVNSQKLSQKPENFHLYEKVYHDSKPLGSKYLPAVEVFPKEVGDFWESVSDICDQGIFVGE